LLENVSRHRCHGGEVGFFKHRSATNDCEMKFAVFLPPQAAAGAVPVLYYLAGLTCSEETFMIKSCALEHAARLGIALVAPDTSPRVELPGDRDSWDFGVAAGFYLNATQLPWSRHYRMYGYITEELPKLIGANFPVILDRMSIFGHSMGGHGALTIALKNPSRYKSVSAFAPICAPSQVPWGEKAFSGYLGANKSTWANYDATELVARATFPDIIRIDQGTADKFLVEQLKPELFVAACEKAGQKLELRMREGYDHGYYFIQSFIAEHLEWHAARLTG
jgi:S-formylglutathione hydrolase